MVVRSGIRSQNLWHRPAHKMATITGKPTIHAELGKTFVSSKAVAMQTKRVVKKTCVVDQYVGMFSFTLTVLMMVAIRSDWLLQTCGEKLTNKIIEAIKCSLLAMYNQILFRSDLYPLALNIIPSLSPPPAIDVRESTHFWIFSRLFSGLSLVTLK